MVYGRQNGLTGGGITKAGTIGMFTSCLHEKCSIADSKTSKDSGKQKKTIKKTTIKWKLSTRPFAPPKDFSQDVHKAMHSLVPALLVGKVAQA